jgi:hypothetical protein
VNTPNVGDHIKPKKRTRKWRLRLSRDGAIFVVGILGIVHEIFLSAVDRPYLILLFGTMIGLPAFLRIDEHGKGGDEE